MRNKPFCYRQATLALAVVGALFAPGFAAGQASSSVNGPAWVTLFDGEPDLPLLGSLNAGPGGYITPSDPINFGGGFGPGHNNDSGEIIPEGPGVVGGIDFSFEYTSSLNIPPGVVFIDNFNIFGNDFDHSDSSSTLSDTLSITFTGHSLAGGSTDNLSIDMHFRSEGEGAPVQSLANAHTIYEGCLPLTQPCPNGPLQGYDDVTSFLIADLAQFGTDDLHVRYTSVPEPATLALLGLGLAGLGFSRRKK